MTLKSLVVTFAVGAAVACNSPAPAPPAAMAPPAPKVRAMTPADNAAWYQACWDQFNKKNWTEFRKCYNDNATSSQIGYGAMDVKGADLIIKSSQDFARMFPDGHGTPQLVLAHGPHVASIYVLEGTNSGPLMGPDGKEMPPTNKKFSQLFAHMVEIDAEGKVMKEIGIQDTGTYMNHLGLSKEPARPPVTAPATPTIIVAKGDATESKNVDVIQQSWDAFNKHDFKTTMSFSAPSLVFHEVAMPADQNLTQASDSLAALWKGFPDAKITLTGVWGAGDYVVSSGTLSGTNTGMFAPMKINKTGRSVNVPMLEIDRLADGKIAETWLFYDGMMFASQLMPPPAMAPAATKKP
jgi:predicted ester cyclase